MYRHCIYCAADLGDNDSIETFPIGRTVAFDAVKGRLWAICARCSRWNLAPIEERWEPVEAAEKAYAETRLRVQRENIGLAKLRDGTRLVRIGTALTGELAAWRYGHQFARRHRRSRWITAATLASYATLIGLEIAGLLPSVLMLAGPGGAVWGASLMTDQVVRNRGVHRLSANPSRIDRVMLRRKHLAGARLAPGAAGELRLVLPESPLGGRSDPLTVDGPEADRLLQRIMVVRNSGGATRRGLAPALERLVDAGSAQALIDRAVRERKELIAGPPPEAQSFKLSRPERPADAPVRVTRPEALALEMALHEESERRALHGELALLQSAWREAEEIAAIADGLAGESALLR